MAAPRPPSSAPYLAGRRIAVCLAELSPLAARLANSPARGRGASSGCQLGDSALPAELAERFVDGDSLHSVGGLAASFRFRR